MIKIQTEEKNTQKWAENDWRQVMEWTKNKIQQKTEKPAAEFFCSRFPVSFLSFSFSRGRGFGERVSGDYGLADRGVGIHGGFHLGAGQPGIDAGR